MWIGNDNGWNVVLYHSKSERPRVDEEEMRARCQDIAEALGGYRGGLLVRMEIILGQ